MPVRLTPFAVISIIASIATSVAYGQSAKEVYAQNSRSVLVIHALDEEGEYINQGSGVVISSDLVATNCHLFYEGFTSIGVQKYDAPDRESDDENGKMDAEIVATDLKLDVCILSVAELADEPAAIPIRLGSANSMSIGEEVYALGAPHGLELSLSRGIVSQLWKEAGDESAPEIQTDVAISGGSSGGALLDSTGKLVGITTYKYTEDDAEGLTFALPVEWVLELLNSQLPDAELDRN